MVSQADRQASGIAKEKTMADKIRVLLNEEEVDRRIKEIAEQINKDYSICIEFMRMSVKSLQLNEL